MNKIEWVIIFVGLVICYQCFLLLDFTKHSKSSDLAIISVKRKDKYFRNSGMEKINEIAVKPEIKSNLIPGCEYPTDNIIRDYVHHIVTPPTGNVHLVCCNSTKGRLTIAVHPSWAPIGAARFLDMVESGFFSTQISLFRAMKGFLVQFGVSGNKTMQNKFSDNLIDDPSWLPLGPSNRVNNVTGVLRYQKGYIAYAGGGANTRTTQLILAFDDNKYLGGGSPWEVPFAQLYGSSSYETLSKIYTGYGDLLLQGKIKSYTLEYFQNTFPNLDYITECVVTQRDVTFVNTDN